MRSLLFAAAALATLLTACAAPCTAHAGTTDGYCDGAVATNCRADCADCNDVWRTQTCTKACTVVSAQPADGRLPSTAPHLSQPKAWAVCELLPDGGI